MTYPATPLLLRVRTSAVSIGVQSMAGTRGGGGNRIVGYCDGRRSDVTCIRMCASVIPNKRVGGSKSVGPRSWQKVEPNDVLVTLPCEIDNRCDRWLDGAGYGCG